MELSKLIERRDAAQKAYKEFVSPLIEENRALTDEETSQKTELRGAVDRLNEAITEAREDEQRETAIAESRSKSGLDRVEPVDARVTHESMVYERNGGNSYMADMAFAAIQGHPLQGEAQQRLSQHSFQLSREVANDTTEGRTVQRFVVQENRGNSQMTSKVIDGMRERGRAEQRTGITTATGSGGAFVPPVYLLDEYAPYRSAGRPFLNAANNKPLPDTGMVINIPVITGPAGIAVQSTQNTSVAETDITTSYVSANVQTVAGQMLLSQQELDRNAYNGGFDSIVFDQLTRVYNAQADQIALTAALANAGSITYTGTFALTTASGAGGFYEKVNGAQAVIRTTAGVFGNPSHLFLQPTRWSWMSSFADSTGRPVIVPGVQGTMNAAAGGNPLGNPGVEGSTGFNMAGLQVWQDANIPVPGTGADQAIVADMSSVLNMEGGLTYRAVPQSDAATLSVRMQAFGYIAVAVLYPLAIQSISGTGLGAITF
jgi:hypothetical protein